MKAAGRLLAVTEDAFKGSDGEQVKMLTAEVVTDEREVIAVRAVGENAVAALRQATAKVEAFGLVSLPVKVTASGGNIKAKFVWDKGE